MAASITTAGERLIAEKQAAHQVLKVERFVIGCVPDLDPDAPVDRDAPKPPTEQIVHVQRYTQKGFVNPNQVVYSLMMGSDIGDFDWNWIGLETEEDVLLMVAYVPLQQKRKNVPPHQIGNNVTRNLMLQFDGAKALTNVTIDASTWQHDFTFRLHEIDERERLANRDLFGRAFFFSNGLRIVKVWGGYELMPGLAFIEGIRVELTKRIPITPPTSAANVWVDVAMMRQDNSVTANVSVQWGEDLQDYRDSAGAQHYLIPIASLSGTGTIHERRTTEVIDEPLITHFAARNGDYYDLRARGTTKEDVELDQIPNAVSDDPWENDSDILPTTKALTILEADIQKSFVGMVAAFDMHNAPKGWLKRNGANVSRHTYSDLFAVLGTRHGAGNGRTTFNIGDSRGLFIRALDDGAGRDPNRGLGTFQQTQNLSHSHTAVASAVGDHIHSASTDAQGNHAHSAWTDSQGHHSHTIDLGRGEEDGRGGGNPGGVLRGSADSTSAAGAHAHNVGIGHAGLHSHAVHIGVAGGHNHAITVHAAGGDESRPVNQALLVCIKY
ncbi:phage tail protein [Pseudomonas koreensis]|nr:phage tail protein [Pseudomonas koreensis]